MGKPQVITMTDWLSELAKMSSRNDEGMTFNEWMDAAGLGRDTLRRKLHEARRLGWLRTGRRTITRMDGVTTTSPVYQIVRPK